MFKVDLPPDILQIQKKYAFCSTLALALFLIIFICFVPKPVELRLGKTTIEYTKSPFSLSYSSSTTVHNDNTDEISIRSPSCSLYFQDQRIAYKVLDSFDMNGMAENVIQCSAELTSLEASIQDQINDQLQENGYADFIFVIDLTVDFLGHLTFRSLQSVLQLEQ